MTRTRRANHNHHRSSAELITTGIAIAILLAVAGLIIYDWVSSQQQPPALRLTREEGIRMHDGQYYVSFTVENTGGDTAEAVQVVAELRFDDGATQSGDQQIAFLAGGETHQGAFVFSRNPAEGDLVLRVASYQVP